MIDLHLSAFAPRWRFLYVVRIDAYLKKTTRLNQSSVLGQVPNTFALMIFSRTAKSSSRGFG